MVVQTRDECSAVDSMGINSDELKVVMVSRNAYLHRTLSQGFELKEKRV